MARRGEQIDVRSGGLTRGPAEARSGSAAGAPSHISPATAAPGIVDPGLSPSAPESLAAAEPS